MCFITLFIYRFYFYFFLIFKVMSYSNVPPPNCLQRRDPKINYEKDEESLKKVSETLFDFILFLV